jgi:hemerythrin-like domain-containing protein
MEALVGNDMEKTVFAVQDEHRSISAVLSGLRELARAAQDPAVRPDFRVLHAMIHYIDAYPEKLHHPKEEEFLFKRLEARAPYASLLLDDLRKQHVRGAELIRELQRSVIGFEVEWPKGASPFVAAVNDYADFHWAHMRKEEQELLPLCERYFTGEDWRAAAAAFGTNPDALGGVRDDKQFQALFSRIVNLAPAPIGLGAPWPRSGPRAA